MGFKMTVKRSKTGLSEWALRQKAEDAGYPTNHGQFDSYRQWNLIPEPKNGRWGEEVVDRLIEIRKAEKQCHTLPRRVIYLRDGIEFPVPIPTLEEAMLTVIPTITAPRRKMKFIHEVVIEFAEYSNPIPASTTTKTKIWKPPTQPSQWIDILKNTREITVSGAARVENKQIGLFNIEPRLLMNYYFNRLLENFLKMWQNGLYEKFIKIPYEERIILLYVSDLSNICYCYQEAKAREDAAKQQQ